MTLPTWSVAVALLFGAIYTIYQYKSLPKYRLSQQIGTVLSVCKSSEHVFSKPCVDSITLIEHLGVEGDCHLGKTVQHRSRLHIRPPPLNLRQVHLIHSELFDEFNDDESSTDEEGVKPGDLGENITTQGLDLLSFGVGTRLHFVNPGDGVDVGAHPVIRVTGLRNPCPQIQRFQNGLQEKCLVRDANGSIVKRKAGIMSVVEVGGVVEKGATIIVQEPIRYEALPCV